MLVETPSVVGTPGEASCARTIYERLAQLPYFRSHPSHLLLEPTRADDRERYNVIAFVRGRQAPEAATPAYLLMGHLDTVDVVDYGPLQASACNPDELARVPGAPPGYLFGRGCLDMKSGVAVNMAVLERFATGAGAQDRSLLFLATPDEEDTGKGMLSFVSMLPELAGRWGFDLLGAINTDYTAPRYGGDPNHYIYAGTIGKLLPYLFVAGLETHVGEPFSGFDPNWLVSEVTRRINYNPDLCDQAYGEVTPPPVSLKLSDHKDLYTVQTALFSWAYFNWFTFTRSSADVLAQFRGLVAGAFAHLHREQLERGAQHGAAGSTPSQVAIWEPHVYTYAELSALVAERVGPELERDAAAKLMQEPGMDLRNLSYRLTEVLWRAAGLPAPVAVVGYAQIYYPPVSLPPDAPLLMAAQAAAALVADEAGIALKVRHFYPYISDMSFLGCPEGPAGLAALRTNSPGWGLLNRIDHEAHAKLNLPVVNIGPWGEGAHTRYERVEKAYSFGRVPEIVWQTLQRL